MNSPQKYDDDSFDNNNFIHNTTNTCKNDDNNDTVDTTTIDIVFSVSDGKLIHYPNNVNEFVQILTTDQHGIIALPSSKTSMVGCISDQKLTMCNTTC
jgi:hypothetical protein